MKNIKRVAALILSLLMLLALLAGCNNNSGGADGSDQPNGGGSNPNSGGNGQGGNSASEFVYRPEYTSFPEGIRWIQSISFGKDRILFTSEVIKGAQRVFYDEEWNMLGHIEIDPSEVEEPLYIDEPVGIYTAGMGTAVAEEEDEEEPSGDEDVTPAETDEPTDEQGRRYNEALDIWYMYSSDELVYGSALYTMPLDGSEATLLEDFVQMQVPEGKEGNFYIQGICAAPDGSIWISESGDFYHFDDEGNYIYDGDASSIRKLSPTGAELFAVDTKKLVSADEYAYFSAPFVDNAGNLYLRDGNSNHLFILDQDGNLKKNVDLGETYLSNLFQVGDQVYGSYYKDGEGNVIAPFDVQSGSFGKTTSLPRNAWDIYPGGGDYSLYYNDGNNFCGLDLETGEAHTLINWIDSDINSDTVNRLFVSDSGEVYAVGRSYESGMMNESWELAKFTKVPASEIPEKTVLTLACVYLDYNLRRAIINYNKANDRYRIRVSDYSVYNTEDDYNAGLTKLSAEIISGVVPDILLTNDLPIETYMKKNLLEDLLPYIQSDPELSGDVILEAFTPIMTADGRLPLIAPNFRFQTVAGAASIVGDQPGWTMQDLQAALQRMPEGAKAFSDEMSRNEILNYMWTMVQDDYIDRENGTCSFNSEEFKSFLRFIAQYPEEINWDDLYGEDYDWTKDSPEAKIAAGKVMLYNTSMSDFWDYQYMKGLFHNQPFTFVGFPSSSGMGSTIAYNVPLAMSVTCADKDGAWDFMRTVMSPDFDSWGFTTNKTRWQQLFEEYSAPNYYYDENGQQVEAPYTQYIGGQEIEISRFSQEDVDHIFDLFRYCRPQFSVDQKVLDIIIEDAGAFFKGQKTVDDVCSSIQSRVTIYINENM